MFVAGLSRREPLWTCQVARVNLTHEGDINHMGILVGRVLQILGLVILPLGVILELTGRLGRRGVAELLLIMVFGFAAFYLGRVVEGYARHS
jgi:hypothetical protein